MWCVVRMINLSSFLFYSLARTSPGLNLPLCHLSFSLSFPPSCSNCLSEWIVAIITTVHQLDYSRGQLFALLHPLKQCCNWASEYVRKQKKKGKRLVLLFEQVAGHVILQWPRKGTRKLESNNNPKKSRIKFFKSQRKDQRGEQKNRFTALSLSLSLSLCFSVSLFLSPSAGVDL